MNTVKTLVKQFHGVSYVVCCIYNNKTSFRKVTLVWISFNFDDGV